MGMSQAQRTTMSALVSGVEWTPGFRRGDATGRASRSTDCPICNTMCAPTVDACTRCGWPIEWFTLKTDISVVGSSTRSSQTAAASGRRKTLSGSMPIVLGIVAAIAIIGWGLLRSPGELNATEPPAATSVSVPADAPAATSGVERRSAAISPEAIDEDAAMAESADASSAVEQETVETRPEPVPARPIEAWRTAAGKLYFGIAPPPGSEHLDAIAPLKPVSLRRRMSPALDVDLLELASARLAPPVPAASVELPGSASRSSYTWRADADCKSATSFEGMRVTVDSARQEQTITGRLRNTADTLIKSVTICRAGACTALAEGRMLEGRDSAPFTLRVPRIDWSPISVECTILEPSA